MSTYPYTRGIFHSQTARGINRLNRFAMEGGDVNCRYEDAYERPWTVAMGGPDYSWAEPGLGTNPLNYTLAFCEIIGNISAHVLLFAFLCWRFCPTEFPMFPSGGHFMTWWDIIYFESMSSRTNADRIPEPIPRQDRKVFGERGAKCSLGKVWCWWTSNLRRGCRFRRRPMLRTRTR